MESSSAGVTVLNKSKRSSWRVAGGMLQGKVGAKEMLGGAEGE